MGKKGKKGGGGGGGKPQSGEGGPSNQPEQQRQPQQQQRPQQQQPPQQQQRPQQQQPSQQQQRPQQQQPPQQQQRPQQQQWPQQQQQPPQQQQRPQQQQWPQQQQQPPQQQQRPQQQQPPQQQQRPQQQQPPQQQQRPQQQQPPQQQQRPQQQQWPQQQQQPPQQQQRPQQQQWPQQQQQPPQQQQRPQQQQWSQQQQQQRTQDVSENFPPPGAGDFGSKKNKKKGGRQGQTLPPQDSGPGPSAAPPQQALQHSQPTPPQQFPQEPRMQQPPGFVTGPVRQTGPPGMVRQRPPSQTWAQQQQAGPPGPRGQPFPWAQRGPPPQQVSQPPSRETTPVQQQPVSSPVSSAPPARQQPQPADQQQVRQQPSQPPVQTQVPAQPRSAPGGSALVEKMKALSTKSTFIPPKRKDRPADPKKGREIIVETNHLNLNIKNKNMVIHHYDVSITPEKPYRNYRQAVEAVRQRCFKDRFPAFDGKKNLYSYPELPILKSELEETVTIYDNERDQEKEMTVTIKYATQVNVSMIWDYLNYGTSTNGPQEAIQALDIVLRQPAANRFVNVGRSFFSPPPGRVIDLGFGLDLWYGFFQSAIIGWKPYLNIDVAHKGFPAGDNCIVALGKFIRGDINDPRLQLKPYELETFVAYIKDLKVVYEIKNKGVKRTYKVTSTTTCPRDNRFDMIDKDTNIKTETTVENYFFTQYGVRLRYPHLPCLVVGSREKPLSLPMELCTIVPGQVTMKKMNDTQTRTMVKEAAVDTERRKQKIVESISKIKFNSDPCLREFGLSVDENFTKVKARIMNAPTVKYREQPVTVRQGTWRSEKFVQGAELIQWRIVNTNRMVRDGDLRKLATDLIQHGKDCGMNISNNYRIVYKDSPRDLEQYFGQCLQEDVKLVIVILPDRGMTYASIKKSAELQVGVLTQCLKSITVQRRLNAATFINILQKINAKLNGVNHHITDSFWPKIFQKPTIIVGADVTHPAPDQVNVPSIAAVAASYDPKAFRYNMIWKLQAPREEVIRDLESIMKEQLLMFYRNTRQKPQTILFYRDGVSEGQFKIILDQELMAIRRACQSLSQDYKPPITFIVVQKRHHTRFFPDRRDADGRNFNVPAGTVVDTEITHPTELDFYLVSHASIQGTARPTKYHLLWDDSNLSEQTLEEITYYLCHLFTRCTRSVSYPAPTYYAHLAAFRARAYTDADRLQLNKLQDEQVKRTVKDSVCKNNPMYYV